MKFSAKANVKIPSAATVCVILPATCFIVIREQLRPAILNRAVNQLTLSLFNHYKILVLKGCAGSHENKRLLQSIISAGHRYPE